jgi:hypothetical protein
VTTGKELETLRRKELEDSLTGKELFFRSQSKVKIKVGVVLKVRDWWGGGWDLKKKTGGKPAASNNRVFSHEIA